MVFWGRGHSLISTFGGDWLGLRFQSLSRGLSRRKGILECLKGSPLKLVSFFKNQMETVLGSLSNKEFKNIRASNLLSSWEGCMSGTH